MKAATQITLISAHDFSYPAAKALSGTINRTTGNRDGWRFLVLDAPAIFDAHQRLIKGAGLCRRIVQWSRV